MKAVESESDLATADPVCARPKTMMHVCVCVCLYREVFHLPVEHNLVSDVNFLWLVIFHIEHHRCVNLE